MLNNGNSLRSRRKRGTGLTARRQITLSPHTAELISKNNINFSAWVENMVLDKFGDATDSVMIKLILKRDDLVAQIEELRQEVQALNVGIEARRAIQEEFKSEKNSSVDKIPDDYPDMDSSEAKNAAFKNDLKGLKKMEDL